jgi:hypothetical protein
VGKGEKTLPGMSLAGSDCPLAFRTLSTLLKTGIFSRMPAHWLGIEEANSSTVGVAGLGEFSPNWLIVPFGQLFKNHRSSPHFGTT